MAKTEHKIERSVQISKEQIDPNPWNPNRMTTRQQDAVGESVDTFGQFQEIVVRPHPEEEGRYQIIDGEHRFNVMEGMIYCNVVTGLTDPEAKKLTIVANETRGQNDRIELAHLLKEIQPEFEDDLITALPYEEFELNEIVQLANIDWDNYEDDFEEKGEEDGNNDDDQKKLTLILTPEDYDLIMQCRDMASQDIDLDDNKAIALGQAIAHVCEIYMNPAGAESDGSD